MEIPPPRGARWKRGRRSFLSSVLAHHICHGSVFSKLLRFYFRLLKSCWLTPLSSLSITELLFPSHVVFLVVWLFPFHHFSHFSFSECGASLGCYHPSRCRSSSSSHFLSRLLTFIFPLIFLFLCLHLLKCFHLSVIYFPFSLSFFRPPWKLPVYTQKLFNGMNYIENDCPPW